VKKHNCFVKHRTFNFVLRKILEDRYCEVRANAKQRVEDLARRVEEHSSYYDAYRDFTDWINSAKEELDRWSDAGGGDKTTMQKKLQKVQVSLFVAVLQQFFQEC